MADDRNSLSWPSIEQLPRVVADKINRFFTVADKAATIIQRKHRGISTEYESGDLRAGKRGDLHDWMIRSAVDGAEKYDGTNVGSLRDGTLLGRRVQIAHDAASYQKTDLTELRSLDTAGALDELLAAGGAAAARVERAALYGELCCNAGLYTYQKQGVAKRWLAFGALLEFNDQHVAAEYARVASAAGLTCGSDDSVVRVCNNETFGNVLRRHNVPVVASTHHESLCEAVAEMVPWMTGEHGEGVVLSLTRHSGRVTSYKWKISREPQPAAIDALSELAEALRNGADGKAQLLDSAIHCCVASLLTVATHVDSSLVQVTAKPPKPVKQAVVDAAALQRAIASALTKFDAVDTFLDTHGHDGVATLTQRLTAEVLCDADLGLPVEGNAARDAAVKEVGVAVKKNVGQQFGAWKKARAGGAAAGGG